jgi:hypothetical protein
MERVPLIFGENIFDEMELPSVISKLSNKWTLHLKAVGLLKNPEKISNFLNWYSDKSNPQIISAIINSNPNSREVYILFDTQEEIEHAYEHWFPIESQLLEEEYYLYVKLIATNPYGIISFTNETPTIQP